MKYTVRFMDLAAQDYNDISDYLSGFYPGTAGKFLDALEKGTATLEDNPRAFEAYEHNPAYRRMVVMDYLVFYKIKEKRKIVEIHRILHGARNIRQFLDRTTGNRTAPAEDIDNGEGDYTAEREEQLAGITMADIRNELDIDAK